MIELTENQKKEVKKLMIQGYSMAEAWVKLGLATKVTTIDCDKEKQPPMTKKGTTAKPKEKKIDAVKAWVIQMAVEALKKSENQDFKPENVIADGTKSIDFTVGDESFTMTLTKHKAKK